jgi:hypothetical protein
MSTWVTPEDAAVPPIITSRQSHELPPLPPAAAGQCGSSTCRSTTATSGTLQVYDDSCKSSVRWSTRSASYVVSTCQTVEYLGSGSVTGSCNGVADGFFYIRIR